MKPNSIPKNFIVQPLRPGQKATARATCGTCKLSWDDAIITSITPAPSARCPFEYFHEEVQSETKVKTKKAICGYDIADGELCRETKLNGQDHCKKHAPEYEPRHTPTPSLEEVKLMRHILENGGYDKLLTDYSVRAVNCHQELLERLKDAAVSFHHDLHDGWLKNCSHVSCELNFKAIAKAEGR